MINNKCVIQLIRRSVFVQQKSHLIIIIIRAASANNGWKQQQKMGDDNVNMVLLIALVN